MKRLKVLYRKNLKMSPGKIAAQAVHAAIGLGANDPMMSVVVLGVSDTKFATEGGLFHFKPDPFYIVRDAGYTEVPAGTETCMAFYEEEQK